MKRNDYIEKAPHHVKMGQKSLEDALFNSEIPVPDDSPITTFRDAQDLMKEFGVGDYGKVQAQLDIFAGRLAQQPQNYTIAQICALLYITEKMSHFNNVRIDELVQAQTKDKGIQPYKP